MSASQITSLTIVYSTVYSGADQETRQSPASLAFVWGIHRWPVNSPHKGPVTRKMFPFDDASCQVPLVVKQRNAPRWSNWTSLLTTPSRNDKKNDLIHCTIITQSIVFTKKHPNLGRQGEVSQIAKMAIHQVILFIVARWSCQQARSVAPPGRVPLFVCRVAPVVYQTGLESTYDLNLFMTIWISTRHKDGRGEMGNFSCVCAISSGIT